jgi:drug/metabolite transporter (DMT)-like permease
MSIASKMSGVQSNNDFSLSAARVSLAIATLLWAGNFIVGRALRDDMAPLELNFWRWIIALAALLPFTLSSLWLGRALIARNAGFIAVLAVTGVVVPHTCVYAALATTNAVNALLLLSVAPLLIILGDWALFGEPMRKRQWLGMSVALIGAITLIARGNVDTLAALQAGTGDLWMIPAILSVATQALMLKRSPKSIAQAPLLSASVIAALIMMLPFMLITGDLAAPPSGIKVVASLLYVGVSASATAFVLWNRGVARLGPGTAAPFLYLMPVYGSILSSVLLGEAAMNFQYIGGGCVFLGLLLARRQRTA